MEWRSVDEKQNGRYTEVWQAKPLGPRLAHSNKLGTNNSVGSLHSSLRLSSESMENRKKTTFLGAFNI